MRFLALAGAIVLSILLEGPAGATPIPLGNADPSVWAVLALGGTLNISAHSGVFGNVGVAAGSAGPDMTMNKGFVQGTVNLAPGATIAPDGDSYVSPTASHLTGGVLNTANLSVISNSGAAASAVSDAISFSASYGAAAATPGTVTCAACSGGSISLANTSSTITLVGAGQHVLNLTNLSLSSATLTITGDSNAFLIINITGSISAQNSNILINGMGDYGVLYNVFDDAGNVASDVDFHSSPTVIHGVLLVTDPLDTSIVIHDGTCGAAGNFDCTQWYGSAFAGVDGAQFVIKSGTTVFDATTTPEPGTLVLLGSGLAGVGLVARKRLTSRGTV